MRLFVIDEIDYTSFIKVPSYKVNALEVYEEWTDANRVTHRDVIRQRVAGGFTMIFDNQTDYLNFLNVIDTKKSVGDGHITGTFYVNNKNVAISVDVFVTCEPANELPILGIKETEGLNIAIEER